MLSSVSSVISGAGAELGAGWSWHYDDHCTNVAGLLYMYRTRVQVGCLYRCPVHCQWSRTSPGDTVTGGTLAHVPSGHQWSWPHPPRVTRDRVQHSAAETV